MTGAMFNVQFQVPWGGGREGSRSKISACHSSNSILVDLIPESLDLVESRIGLTKSIYHYIILVNPILCLLLCPASCWNIARVKVLGSLSFFVVVLFWSWSRKLYRMLSKTKNGQNWAILGLLSWTVQKTSQELRMLSLSLFIQGSLWMMRFLFSIARNVISVSQATNLGSFIQGVFSMSLSSLSL